MMRQKEMADWRTQTPLGGHPMRVRQRTEEYNLPEVDELAKIEYKRLRKIRGENFRLIILVVVAGGYRREGGDSVLDGVELLHQYQK
jgi:hypothetical protein